MGAESFTRLSFSDLISAQLLEIGDGYRATNSELGGDGLIFLRAGHVTDTHIEFAGADRFRVEFESRFQTKVARAGDAIVTTKGNSTGRTAFVSEQMPSFVYSPHLSYWRSKDPSRLDSGFLRYWSRSAEFIEQLAGMKASTDMAPYLSLVDQKRLRISLPPVGVQRAIARILGTLDDKIDLNRQVNATLEAMAKALFKSWFVDFDPIRAAAERTSSGPSEGIVNLLLPSFDGAQIDDPPTNWVERTVADIASVSRESIDPLGSPAEEFDHFSIPAYDDGRRPKVELGGAIKSNKFIVPAESVLISKLNPRLPRVWRPTVRQEH